MSACTTAHVDSSHACLRQYPIGFGLRFAKLYFELISQEAEVKNARVTPATIQSHHLMENPSVDFEEWLANLEPCMEYLRRSSKLHLPKVYANIYV